MLKLDSQSRISQRTLVETDTSTFSEALRSRPLSQLLTLGRKSSSVSRGVDSKKNKLREIAGCVSLAALLPETYSTITLLVMHGHQPPSIDSAKPKHRMITSGCDCPVVQNIPEDTLTGRYRDLNQPNITCHLSRQCQFGIFRYRAALDHALMMSTLR